MKRFQCDKVLAVITAFDKSDSVEVISINLNIGGGKTNHKIWYPPFTPKQSYRFQSEQIFLKKEYPILIIFYAFGYATGNVVGILAERKLAFGLIILKVITKKAGKSMADRLREMGQPVTVLPVRG